MKESQTTLQKKKLLHKAIEKCPIKTPRRALGLYRGDRNE